LTSDQEKIIINQGRIRVFWAVFNEL